MASLSPEDYALLAAHLSFVELPQGMILSEAEDRISHVYFPEDGLVSFVIVTRSGQTVEAACIGREGIVGSISSRGTGVATTQSMVQVPGSGYRMEVSKFHAALARSAGIRSMADLYTEGLLAQTLQSVACMAFHSVEARCARWLLTARDQIESDTIALTQEFLAQMLGCQRTTVTLVAHTMQAAGLIRYSRGKIEVLQAGALEESACECYAQTRDRYERIFPPRY